MSVPIIVNDGNFNEALQTGPWEYSFPFSNVGDAVTFIARRPMRIDAEAMRRSTMMQRRTFPGFGYGYLVEIVPSRAPSDSSGLLDYEEVWASVPQTRDWEYESISYTEQPSIIGLGGDNPQVIEITKSKNARVIWEFSLGPLPQLLAPRVEIINGTAFSFAGWSQIAVGQEVLADDSENGIYMCRIYQRKRRLATITAYNEIV